MNRLGLKASGGEDTVREITQQPSVWLEVARTVAERRVELDAFLDAFLTQPGSRIVLTGAGSSAFAGEVLAPALTRSLWRRVDAVATTDIVSNPREVFAEDVPTLLVSFARSGDSPESIAATVLADESLSVVRHLVVTCNGAGRLAKKHYGEPNSLVLLMPAEANDRGFAMTSSFTSMLLATLLTLDRTALSTADVEQLAAAADDVLTQRVGDVARLADSGYDRIVYVGSGPLTAVARESALKLLELTAGRVVSYFDSCLGFRHGPKSVLHPGTLALVYLSNDDYTRRYDNDILDELRSALGAEHVVAVTGRTGHQRADDESVWRLTGLDEQPDVALALPFLVVAQLLALHMSVAVGATPDNPFPDGEVNRVVKGVTIYPVEGA